jgi:ribosomal protein S6
MAKSTLWSLAGVALVAAAVVTPMREELLAVAQPSAEEAYLSCLTKGLETAEATSVRRMVPAYKGCADKEQAYRNYLQDQGVRAERVQYVISRVNEANYARFVGSAADRQLGCFERQMKKVAQPLIS